MYESHQLELGKQIKKGLDQQLSKRNNAKIAVGGHAAKLYLDEMELEHFCRNGVCYFRDAIVFREYMVKQILSLPENQLKSMV
ncbi:MAG: hypothetical protein ACOH5I_06725 [Oligoflexus sp.]